MARKEALRILGEVVNGQDPAAIRSDDKAARTVSELCSLYLLEAGAGKY